MQASRDRPRGKWMHSFVLLVCEERITMTTDKQELPPLYVECRTDVNDCGYFVLRNKDCIVAEIRRDNLAVAEQYVGQLARALALVEELKGDKEHLLNVIAELRERINKNDPNRTL